jgi:AraC-like DNA-binding protein
MKSSSSTLTFPECPVLLHAGVGVHGGGGRHERFLLESGVWALHAYPYEAEIEWKGTKHRIEPGTVGLTPADQPVVYYFQGHCQHRYVHFLAPRETASAPCLLRDADLYARVWEDVGRLMTLQQASPRHAGIMLWNLLLLIGENARHETGHTPRHPAVEATLSLIETEMNQPIGTAQLADRVGISQNHLIRLFLAEFGIPVGSFLRRRRVEHAAHLLRHTDLPVKTIAAAVGFSDLQAFNKFIRLHLGSSPRRIRVDRS